MEISQSAKESQQRGSLWIVSFRALDFARGLPARRRASGNSGSAQRFWCRGVFGCKWFYSSDRAAGTENQRSRTALAMSDIILYATNSVSRLEDWREFTVAAVVECRMPCPGPNLEIGICDASGRNVHNTPPHMQSVFRSSTSLQRETRIEFHTQ